MPECGDGCFSDPILKDDDEVVGGRNQLTEWSKIKCDFKVLMLLSSLVAFNYMHRCPTCILAPSDVFHLPQTTPCSLRTSHYEAIGMGNRVVGVTGLSGIRLYRNAIHSPHTNALTTSTSVLKARYDTIVRMKHPQRKAFRFRRSMP